MVWIQRNEGASAQHWQSFQCSSGFPQALLKGEKGLYSYVRLGYFSQTERKLSEHFWIQTNDIYNCLEETAIKMLAAGFHQSNLHLQVSEDTRFSLSAFKTPVDHQVFFLNYKMTQYLQCRVVAGKKVLLKDGTHAGAIVENK